MATKKRREREPKPIELPDISPEEDKILDDIWNKLSREIAKDFEKGE